MSAPGAPLLRLRRLAAPCWGAALLGWDGDQRLRLLTAGIRQREEQHDGRKGAFRCQVALLNPEPVATVPYRSIWLGGPFLATVNP